MARWDGEDNNTPSTDITRRFVLPDEVWTQTQLLDTVRRAALARQVSPDAVLHSALAVVSSLLHHRVRLNTGKGATPLNHYAALIGASGAGKTEAIFVANDLLRTWINDRFAIVAGDGYFQGPLGTGEGVVEVYMGMITKPKVREDGSEIIGKDGLPLLERVRGQVRHNALVVSDEGRALLALDARKGSTALATLCSMWSGSLVGSTNADAERNRRLDAGSYVLGLLLGFQPGTIAGLFADEAGGAPQRFFYGDTRHPDITADEIDWPGGLKLDIPVGELALELPKHLQREVRVHQAARARGELALGPLDGHRMLLRCRLTGLLALMHTEQITQAHWELAGLMLDTSCALRDEMAQLHVRQAAEEARQQQESQIRVQVVAAQKIGHADAVRRVADRVVTLLEKGPRLEGDIKSQLSSNQRPLFDDAIAVAIADGRLASEERAGSPRGGPQRVTVLRVRNA